MKLKRSLSEYVRRYICFTISLFIMALGVAISTKSDLGTSPVSCVPYVLSLGLPLSMGVTTIIWNAVFILVQIILQRRDFKPFQLLQIATISVFGYFTDFALALVSWINVDTYIMRWVLCIISSMVIAIGVSLEVKSDVLMLAGEGTMTVISNKFGIEFGKVKTGFDCTQIIRCKNYPSGHHCRKCETPSDNRIFLKKSQQKQLFYHQQGKIIHAPQNKVPSGAMP